MQSKILTKLDLFQDCIRQQSVRSWKIACLFQYLPDGNAQDNNTGFYETAGKSQSIIVTLPGWPLFRIGRYAQPFFVVGGPLLG